MTLDEILKTMRESDSFIILTHDNPDGDAIGSSLAVATVLKEMGKVNIDVVVKECPANFMSLPNIDMIKNEGQDINYDMAIVVDCPNVNRVHEDYIHYIEEAISVAQFDHHLNNSMFGDYNVVNSASPACAQILVSSFQYLNIEMSKDVITCLMAGIITDTGGFRFNSVTAETFEFAGWALTRGVNISKIYKDVMMTKTKAQFEAEKLAVDRIEFFADEKITFTYFTKEDEKKLNIQSGELDGIVDIGRNIKGVEVAIFVRERDNGFKASFRSNSIDIAEICMLFGGGGHKLAAGCTVDAPLEEVKKVLVEETRKNLKK